MLTQKPKTSWKFIDNGSRFCVKDANGKNLAHDYDRDPIVLQEIYQNKEDALELAKVSARLSHSTAE